MLLLTTQTVTLSQIQWGMIFGGFGLFLFGCQYMGDGLKSFAGDKLREYIEKYTKSPWQGILIGAGITAFIQSSAATTAITIGLIRAGLMKLNQAVGIIMGANIGTTMTAFLISFNIEGLILYFIFGGAMLLLFASRKKIKYLGQVFLGFGILFYGLTIMGDELNQLKYLPQFMDAVNYLSTNSILALIASAIMTAVIQSSSALIGIVQKMYDAGGITLSVALPFLFGSNIGTTVTAIFASLGGSLPARRAAMIHVLFNVIGSVLFMLILPGFESLVLYLATTFNLAPMMQIAISHIIFNIVVTILFYPFIDKLVKLVKLLVRGEEKIIDSNLDELNEDLAVRLPSSALEVAQKATLKMGNICLDNITEVLTYLETKNSSCLETIQSLESTINACDKKISDYLILIAQSNLGNEEAHHYQSTMQVSKNIERISDLCTNLSEFFEMIFDAHEKMSEEAQREIKEMLTLVHNMLSLGLECYMNHDEDSYHKNKEYENQLDKLEEFARTNHIKRMANKTCVNAVAGSVFVDIVGSIERMGDHAENISRYTINHERAI